MVLRQKKYKTALALWIRESNLYLYFDIVEALLILG